MVEQEVPILRLVFEKSFENFVFQIFGVEVCSLVSYLRPFAFPAHGFFTTNTLQLSIRM